MNPCQGYGALLAPISGEHSSGDADNAGDLNKLHTAAKNERISKRGSKSWARASVTLLPHLFTWHLAESRAFAIRSCFNWGQGARPLAKSPDKQSRALCELKTRWIREAGQLSQFSDFEAALLRHGLAVRKTNRARSMPTANQARTVEFGGQRTRAVVGFQLRVKVARAIAAHGPEPFAEFSKRACRSARARKRSPIASRSSRFVDRAPETNLSG